MNGQGDGQTANSATEEQQATGSSVRLSLCGGSFKGAENLLKLELE